MTIKLISYLKNNLPNASSVSKANGWVLGIGGAETKWRNLIIKTKIFCYTYLEGIVGTFHKL